MSPNGEQIAWRGYDEAFADASAVFVASADSSGDKELVIESRASSLPNPDPVYSHFPPHHLSWGGIAEPTPEPTPEPSPTPTLPPGMVTCSTVIETLNDSATVCDTTGCQIVLGGIPNAGSVEMYGKSTDSLWYKLRGIGWLADETPASVDGWVAAEELALVDEFAQRLGCLDGLALMDDTGATLTPTPNPTPTLSVNTALCDANTSSQGATLYSAADDTSPLGSLPANLAVGLLGRRQVDDSSWWYFVRRGDDWHTSGPAQGWIQESDLFLQNTASSCLETLPIMDNDGSITTCIGYTIGIGELRVREQPNTISSIILTITPTPPPPRPVSVTGRIHPENNADEYVHVWYQCAFPGLQGWMRDDLVDMTCQLPWIDSTGNPVVPVSTPVPMPDCLVYVDGGNGQQVLADGELYRVPVGHDYREFPPCDLTLAGSSIQRIPSLFPEDSSAAQYSSAKQGQPIVNDYNQINEPDIGDAMTYNSCGFVASAAALRYLGYDVWPYELLINAARNGVDPNQSGYTWLDIRNSLNVLGENEFLSVADADMAAIRNLVFDSRHAAIISYVSISVQDDGSPSDGLLTDYVPAGANVVPHWVLVTGMSTDGSMIRILNPFNNREEFYAVEQYESSRVPSIYTGYYQIFIIAKHGDNARDIWCDNITSGSRAPCQPPTS